MKAMLLLGQFELRGTSVADTGKRGVHTSCVFETAAPDFRQANTNRHTLLDRLKEREREQKKMAMMSNDSFCWRQKQLCSTLFIHIPKRDSSSHFILSDELRGGGRNKVDTLRGKEQ